MLDHIGIGVSDYKKSKSFYQAALAPLGQSLVMEFEGWAGFGFQSALMHAIPFWIHQRPGQITPTHVAFQARERRLVHLFHEAALAAGGRDNGAPGLRTHYHPTYYGAFVFDPDGHNIEAVCHAAE